jgi:hypothetical protein
MENSFWGRNGLCNKLVRALEIDLVSKIEREWKNGPVSKYIKSPSTTKPSSESEDVV